MEDKFISKTGAESADVKTTTPDNTTENPTSIPTFSEFAQTAMAAITRVKQETKMSVNKTFPFGAEKAKPRPKRPRGPGSVAYIGKNNPK